MKKNQRIKSRGKKKEEKKFSFVDLARHPLVLIMASALLSYIIIPAINNISERNKRIGEEKMKLASVIVEHHLDVDKTLNAVYVALDLFYKDNKRVTSLSELNRLRGIKSLEMRNIYSAFDNNAWYWESHYALRARTLGLAETEIDSLRVLFRVYQNLLISSVREIDKVWTGTLRTNRFFSDSLDGITKSARDSIDIYSSKRNMDLKAIVQFLSLR